mgnify:CR=1 FL=1
MSDWQKMLDILMHEKPEDYNNDDVNPLIKEVTEYLYKILLFLKGDLENEKVLVKDEKTKNEVEQIMDIDYYDIKCRILNSNVICSQMQGIQKANGVFQNTVIKEYINSPSFYKRHKIKKYDLKNLHQAVCKNMFKKIGNSYKNNTYLWVAMDVDADEQTEQSQLNSSFIEESRRSIKLEIISSEILSYDGYIFDMLRDTPGSTRESIKEIYRPYLVEYYVELKKLGEQQRTFLQQMYNMKGWYKAKLADMTTDMDTKDSIIFEGVFAHSASPVEYENKKLVICDKRVDSGAMNKINSKYNMDEIGFTSDADIQNELKKIFKDVRFQTTRIYKVGNGNCIYNYGKNRIIRKRFFYDIGFDMHVNVDANSKKTEEKYKAALKNIRRAKPHCIILSHWDEDHFRGCVYAKKDIFDTRWIAPNIKNSEQKGNAKRLLIYLHRIGSLMVVKRGYAREIVIRHAKNSQMILYVGNRKRGTDKEITNCNCQGIAIRMENNIANYRKIRCLMEGDLPYMSLPPEANFATENPYDYLVVPHHGAKMDCSLLNTKGNKHGQAVICCTNNINANRPSKNHKDALINCYNDVKTTEESSCYIQLNLRKSKNMRII